MAAEPSIWRKEIKLRREETILTGSGRIGFGGSPDEGDEEITVSYRCE